MERGIGSVLIKRVPKRLEWEPTLSPEREPAAIVRSYGSGYTVNGDELVQHPMLADGEVSWSEGGAVEWDCAFEDGAEAALFVQLRHELQAFKRYVERLYGVGMTGAEPSSAALAGDAFEARLEAAVEDAEGAFWARFARHYREATTGDLSPEDSNRITSELTVAGRRWLEANVLHDYTVIGVYDDGTGQRYAEMFRASSPAEAEQAAKVANETLTVAGVIAGDVEPVG